MQMATSWQKSILAALPPPVALQLHPLGGRANLQTASFLQKENLAGLGCKTQALCEMKILVALPPPVALHLHPLNGRA